MGTDNPKVSAYVPQTLKDRLKEFREERDNISESQAVTIILAEYFQMPEALGRSPQGSHVGGVTLARMEALEERLLDFTASVDHRLRHLGEEIRKITGILVVHDGKLDSIASDGKQSSSLLGEPQITSEVIEQVEEPVSQLEMDLENGQYIEEDAGTRQLELIEPALPNLPSEPLEEISPIPGIKLSKLRFGLSESRISAMRQKMLKKEMSLEEFTQWTKDKDPDGIPWKFIENPKGYVPAEDLSDEQKSSLLKWIKENLH